MPIPFGFRLAFGLCATALLPVTISPTTLLSSVFFAMPALPTTPVLLALTSAASILSSRPPTAARTISADMLEVAVASPSSASDAPAGKAQATAFRAGRPGTSTMRCSPFRIPDQLEEVLQKTCIMSAWVEDSTSFLFAEFPPSSIHIGRSSLSPFDPSYQAIAVCTITLRCRRTRTTCAILPTLAAATFTTTFRSSSTARTTFAPAWHQIRRA